MRLDCSGNLYPAIATREHPQIYRVSVALATMVVPQFLKQAVKETLPHFPTFHVQMRKGFFWYYLEDTEKEPEIKETEDSGIQPLPKKGPAYRFLYEKNWIHLEVFHALTDGTGAMHFLHAVCYRYCQLAYQRLLPPEILEKRYGLEGAGDFQDAYQDLRQTKGSFWKLLKKKPAFRIPGKRQADHFAAVHTLKIFLPDLKKISRQHHATVCELLTASCLRALWLEFREKAVKKGRKLRVAVPVNLRPFFSVRTERNFFTCISVEMDPKKDGTLETLIQEVKQQFSEQCHVEFLQEQVSGQVAGQQSTVSKYTPLVLKNWFLRRVYQYNGCSTTVLSNLGNIHPLDEFAFAVIGYQCVLPLTEQEPLKIAVCSCQDTLVLTVTSSLKKNEFPEVLGETLNCAGIPVRLEAENHTAQRELSPILLAPHNVV